MGPTATTKPNGLTALLGLTTTGSTKQGGASNPYDYSIKKEVSIPKDPYSYDLKKPAKKKDEEIDEDLDEFQNSQNSSLSRRNPLFESTENSGMYDQSVNSVDIEDYDYYENVKKRKR